MDSLTDFLISDTHFFHNGIVKYCQRPGFDRYGNHDINRHNILMNENWWLHVQQKDSILHLGDLAFRAKDEKRREELEAMLQDLPGKKYLIRGNHDDEYSDDWFNEMGFEIVEPFSYVRDGVEFVFSHYPYKTLSKNQINVHGHIHNNYIEGIGRHHINVGVDMRSMSPVPTETIVENGIYRIRKERVRRDYQ